MNMQTDKDMHANLVKYHVYHRLKADEHKANLNLTMPKFDFRWNIVYACLRNLGYGY